MIAVITLIIGLAIGWVVGRGSRGRRRGRRPSVRQASRLPSATDHLLDLLRRAHGARLAGLARRHHDPIVAGGQGADPRDRERLEGLARLAMGDGREHVVRDDDATLLAVGDGAIGLAMALPPGEDETRFVDATAEMRRLLGELRVDYARGIISQASPGKVETALPPGLDTFLAVASGLCDRTRIITGRPTLVVARDADRQTASVVAVSNTADRRFHGLPVAPDSAVGRACLGEAVVTAGTVDDLFGRQPEDRRARSEHAVAFPLRDGNRGIGALVVFGANDLEASVQERVMWLAVDAAPRFAAASAVHAAEQRSRVDPLTGLANRLALQRAMANVGGAPCAVLCVDIDHFKKINDGFGHAAGDAALKHLARLFQAVLREEDLPVRVGGEEFVLWLPHTNRESALDVAERVRKTVATTRWMWAGAEISLTCSIGVATRPGTTAEVANLVAAADAALYRAKEGGRDRVEEATAAPRASAG